MADAQTLVDQVCADAGIDATAGTTDRAQALSCLNRALKRVAIDTGGFRDIARFTVTSRDYNLITTPQLQATTVDADASSNFSQVLNSIDWIGVSDSTGVTEFSSRLQRVSPERLLNLRPPLASSSSSPQFYAVNWPVLMLDAVPSGGANLVVGYQRDPATLTDASSSYPQEIPSLFHEDLLGKLAVVILLEGYEGREQDAAYHRQLYAESLDRYMRWRVKNGGIDSPDDGTALDAWSTPSGVSVR